MGGGRDEVKDLSGLGRLDSVVFIVRTTWEIGMLDRPFPTCQYIPDELQGYLHDELTTFLWHLSFSNML